MSGYNSNYGGGGSNGEMSAQEEAAMKRAAAKEAARRDKIVANIRAKNPFYPGQLVTWSGGMSHSIGEFIRLQDSGTLAEVLVREAPPTYPAAGETVGVDVRLLKPARQPLNRVLNLKGKTDALGNVLNARLGPLNGAYSPASHIQKFAGLKMPKIILPYPHNRTSLTWRRAPAPNHLKHIGNVFNAIENNKPKPGPGGGALGPNNVARRKRKTRRNTRRGTRRNRK